MGYFPGQLPALPCNPNTLECFFFSSCCSGTALKSFFFSLHAPAWRVKDICLFLPSPKPGRASQERYRQIWQLFRARLCCTRRIKMGSLQKHKNEPHVIRGERARADRARVRGFSSTAVAGSGKHIAGPGLRCGDDLACSPPPSYVPLSPCLQVTAVHFATTGGSSPLGPSILRRARPPPLGTLRTASWVQAWGYF